MHVSFITASHKQTSIADFEMKVNMMILSTIEVQHLPRPAGSVNIVFSDT